MSTYSTSSIPQGIAIYANATLFPVTAQDGEQAVAADTNTLYIYDTSVPGWQAVANPGAAIAIDALTGEVTATGPGVVAATISAGAVTNAKLAAMADNTVKGNKSGAPASPSDLALSNVTEAVSSVLTISNGSKTVVSAADLTIEVKQSSAVQSGYLSSGDWSTFSNKVSSVGATAPIASSGGTTPTISISQSGVATDGYLSSADWNSFNSKQPAGNYITALTSDVTATGPGSVAATVAFVGGKTAAEVATSVTDTQNATALSTPSTLMERDGSGETALDGLSLDGSTSGAIKLQAAATTTNYTVKLPSAQGAASTFLQNDGSGNLAWTAVPDELPPQTGNAEKVLSTNGTSPTWQYAGLGNGSFGTNNVFLGKGKLASLTTGNNNIVISPSTAGDGITNGTGNIIISNTGVNSSNFTSNTIIGMNISPTFSGSESTLIGADITATSGFIVTAVGRQINVGGSALCVAVGNSISVNGSDSVAVGYGSSVGGYGVTVGRSSSSGNAGTVLGSQSAGTGSNIVVGNNSYSRGTSGITIGVGSGVTAASGNSNTVVGSNSFNSASLTTAASCVVVGQAAATAVTTASNLTTVGMNSCLQLTTGSENTVLGYYAGSTNSNSGISTGSQNVCLGARAGLGLGTDSNATAVGFQARAASSAVGVGAACYESSTYGTSVGAACANVSSTNTYTVRVGYAVGNTANPFGSYNGPIGGARSVFIGALTNGTRLATAYTDNNDCIFIGYSAGSRSQSTSNELFIDNQDRSSYANQQTKSIIYGVMNATETSQRLSLNAQVKLSYGEKHASVHGQTGTANVITATVNNYYIGVDSTLAAKTVNLPAAATAGQGFVLSIKDEGGLAGTNNITIDANGAELIDGAATQPINANYGSLNLMCSGTAWFII